MIMRAFKKDKGQKKEERPRSASVDKLSQGEQNKLYRSRTKESSNSEIKNGKKRSNAIKSLLKPLNPSLPNQKENGDKNHPQPNSPPNQTRKSQQSGSGDLVRSKYIEVSNRLDQMESDLQAETVDIKKALQRINPTYNTDKATTPSEGHDIKRNLDQFISRTKKIKELELQDKITEKEKLQKETDTSDAHLAHLKEALTSAKKDFQCPEYNERMTDLFEKLKTEFNEQFKKNPKSKNRLIEEYDQVLLFIADPKNKCGRCHSVQKSIDTIQSKIKDDDPVWLENLNSKIAITLPIVDHGYRHHDHLRPNFYSSDIVEELHKLYSGYKNKIKHTFDPSYNPYYKYQTFDINGYDALLKLTPQKKPSKLRSYF